MLTEQQREAYARADSNTRILTGVELRHSQFPSGVLRIISFDFDVQILLRDSAPINAGQVVTYFGNGIEAVEPEASTEPDGPMTIKTDGVSGYLEPYLANANQTREIIQATIRPIAYDMVSGTASQTFGDSHFQVRHVAITLGSVLLTLGSVNLANMTFPGINYNADTHPGLY